MFIYVFSITGVIDRSTCPEDLRFVEDRRLALFYMKVLGVKPRVVVKPV